MTAAGQSILYDVFDRPVEINNSGATPRSCRMPHTFRRLECVGITRCALRRH